MPVFGTSKNTDYFDVDDFNTNSMTSSQSFYMNGATDVGVFVIGKTGTHNTHAIKIEASPDDVNWFDAGIAIAGVGTDMDTTVIAKYLRVTPTAAEGVTSTCDVKIVVK